MKVILKRAWSDDRCTLGMLTIEGVKHDPFFTLENPARDTSKDNRIPKGSYICEPYSGMKYKNVYIVKDVPGRSAILIHWGNFESHTEGCLLLGDGAGMLNGQPAITASKPAFERFRNIIGKNIFTLFIEE